MQVDLLNYRAFRRTSLRLGPLTVILGPNASGKTSLLRALNPSIGVNHRDVFQRQTACELSIEVRGPASGMHRIRLTPDGHNIQDGSNRYGFQLLALDTNALRSQGGLSEQHRLSGAGGNLVNVFDTLTRAEQSEVSKEFCALVPVFRDVDRAPVINNQQQLRFEDAFRKGVWYTPDEVSDGSILTFAFLLLRFQKPQVDVIAIEEPERALHPYLVERVISLLRDLAEGKIGGRKMHIVLTTHSPSTVDFCRPEEVRILDRLPDGSVEIKELPTGTANWREGFEVYGRSLGAVWLSGGVGGVPSS